MKHQYQSLYENRIFIGAASDAESMILNEACDVIIDLRAEAAEQPSENTAAKRIHVPLVDKQEGQEALIQRAIDEIVRAYQEGKKVGVH